MILRAQALCLGKSWKQTQQSKATPQLLLRTLWSLVWILQLILQSILGHVFLFCKCISRVKEAFVCKLQSCGTALLSSEKCRLPQRGIGILCNDASIITHIIVQLYTSTVIPTMLVCAPRKSSHQCLWLELLSQCLLGLSSCRCSSFLLPLPSLLSLRQNFSKHRRRTQNSCADSSFCSWLQNGSKCCFFPRFPRKLFHFFPTHGGYILSRS